MRFPQAGYVLTMLIMTPLTAWCQDFPKGWAVPFELGQGFVRPAGGPELYLVGLQVTPQLTVIENRMRLGFTAGGFYNANRIGGLAGPHLAVKLAQGKPILTASSYNIHVFGEYLWGTGQQQLPGGGIGIETSNLLALSLKLHRDIIHQSTWFQFGIAFSPFIKKFPEP